MRDGTLETELVCVSPSRLRARQSSRHINLPFWGIMGMNFEMRFGGIVERTGDVPETSGTGISRGVWNGKSSAEGLERWE
jgi:hypothetical protein